MLNNMCAPYLSVHTNEPCATFVVLKGTGICLCYEDSDRLAWLYPSPYTAAHRFGIVIMALNSVFMQVDVNDNFFENDVVCTMLLLKTEGGKYSFL